MGILRPEYEGGIGKAIAQMRAPLRAVAVFSGVVSILGLTGSVFMLQVYDRVLASRSVSTLVALGVLAFALYALQGVMDLVRAQVLARIGASIERTLIEPVHAVVLRLQLQGRNAAEQIQPIRDLEVLRQFMGSMAPAALFDLPWSPLYLVFLFWLHPLLGFMTLAAVGFLVLLTRQAEGALQTPTHSASQAQARRGAIIEANRRNVEVIRAMGFANHAQARFAEASHAMLDTQRDAADIAARYQNISKYFRIAFQSLMLATGAWLVIRGQMSAGSIIASSILSGRALAPIDLVIGSWKAIVGARQAYGRLSEVMQLLPPAPARTALPLAKASVSVENLAVAAPGGRQPLVRNVSFRLAAGDGLAILGPSGAGKSTLIRALVGAWPTLGGAVRLDGAPLEQWPEASLARLIGYLPQDVELFEGSVAQNIARLDPAADDEAIVAAARAANVHDMVLRLPQGYQTRLGEGGVNLSVGQRQRIGLARALYGDPFLVALDEPNAHLDQEGEAALAEALKGIRLRGGVVVLVAHRRAVLQSVNRVALVVEGEMRAFGPRDETLARIEAAAQRPRPPSAPGWAAAPLVRVATPLARMARQAGPNKDKEK